MRALYVETSALVTWLFGDRGSVEIHQQLSEAESIATSALTFLEAERAILRREELEPRRMKMFKSMRAELRAFRERCVVMEVSEEILRNATRRFPREPVRSLDAIHLMSAIRFLTAFPELRMLTLDDRIGRNAEELELSA